MPFGRIEIRDVRPRTPTGHPPKGCGRRAGRGLRRHPARRPRPPRRPGPVARPRASGPGGPRRWPRSSTTGGRAASSPTEVGLHELVIEAWTDRFGTWRDHAREASRRRRARPRRRAARRCRAPRGARAGRRRSSDRERLLDAAATLRSPTCSVRTKLDAGLDDHLADVVAGVADEHDLTRLKTPGCGSTASAAAVSALVRAVPPQRGRLRRRRPSASPAIAEMGFDVVYLPPIHPIGTHPPQGPGQHPRRRRPTTPAARGRSARPEGGHDAIAPRARHARRLRRLRRRRPSALGMEVALDYALQCSPDHPWVREHPEWFHHRPDGSIRYAENPPKKYQDIYPINFWPDGGGRRVALWAACRDILEHWIGHGRHGSSASTTPTPSRSPSGSGSSPTCTRRAPRRALPGRGVHPAEGDGTSWPRSASPRATRTSRGARQQWELREYGDGARPGPGGRLHAAQLLAQHARHPRRPAAQRPAGRLPHARRAGRHARAQLRACTRGYELCENEPQPATPTRSTSTPRSTRSSARDWGAPELDSAPFVTALNAVRRRHPALQRAAHAPLPRHDRRRAPARVLARRRPTAPTSCSCVVNLDPDGGPGGHAAARPRRPRPRRGRAVRGPRRADRRRPSRGSGRRRRTCASTRPTRPGRPRRCALARERAARREPRARPRRPTAGTSGPSSTRCSSAASTTPTATAPATSAGSPRSSTTSSGSASTASGCCPSTSRRCATAATTSATSSRVLPEYGDVDDAAELVEEAHRRGIRVIADLVMNHTSDQHPWFQESPPGPRPTRRPTGTSGTTTTSAGPRPGSSSSTPSRRTGPTTRSASSTTGTASSTTSPTSTTTTPRSPRRCSTSSASGSTSASTASASTPCPYLFERDGTNGENLPETHEYLRRLRKDGRRRVPRQGAAGRGQPVARRRRRLLRRRRRVPHVLPLPAHAAHVHGGAAGAALPDHRDPGPDAGDPRRLPVGHLPAQPRRADPRDGHRRGARLHVRRVRQGPAHEAQRRHPPPAVPAARQRPPGRRAVPRPAVLACRAARSCTTATRSAWATTSTSATATACARRCSGRPTATAASRRADFAQLYLPPLMDPVYGFQAVNVEAAAARPELVPALDAAHARGPPASTRCSASAPSRCSTSRTRRCSPTCAGHRPRRGRARGHRAVRQQPQPLRPAGRAAARRTSPG